MSLNEPFADIRENRRARFEAVGEDEVLAAFELRDIYSAEESCEFGTETCIGIESAITICHGLAKRAGWWNDPATGEPKDRNDGELIALMHSELSEALEGLRKDRNDEHLPHRKSVEVELADTLIRIFDYAGARNLDLAGAVIEKLAFNQRRADHKPAARLEADGKKF